MDSARNPVDQNQRLLSRYPLDQLVNTEEEVIDITFAGVAHLSNRRTPRMQVVGQRAQFSNAKYGFVVCRSWQYGQWKRDVVTVPANRGRVRALARAGAGSEGV